MELGKELVEGREESVLETTSGARTGRIEGGREMDAVAASDMIGSEVAESEGMTGSTKGENVSVETRDEECTDVAGERGTEIMISSKVVRGTEKEVEQEVEGTKEDTRLA